MTPSSPVLMTIRTSRTCRVWRQLLLGSPSIWGKLINLNSLYFSSDLQNELIRRTRNAPLWTTGSELVYHRGSATWRQNTLLVPFVQQHWRRVYSLRLSLNLNSWDLYEGLWAAISQVAPSCVMSRYIFRHMSHCSRKKCYLQALPRSSILSVALSLLSTPQPLGYSNSFHFHSRAAHYPFPTPQDIVSTLFRATSLEVLRFSMNASTPQLARRQVLSLPSTNFVMLLISIQVQINIGRKRQFRMKSYID
ncbi:hypothetical protein CPB83DRAFT_859682 [Crepidotus variabilis]|uniref:F-box domain-containing protein n=1 Tax=Crepidotus variabilis TaxID=179855 RepID=A0A9P6JLI7_9AGAR|nr:hypothetical protein CPB83DRAFT_859682 [Crepidotus variabilis]